MATGAANPVVTACHPPEPSRPNAHARVFHALAVVALAVHLVHALSAQDLPGWSPALVREFLTTPSDESAPAAELRHQLVAARRKGPLILVHRGATAFAPENTLEACAAAMDYGADGVEIDLRRTSDGVVVLFHDDTLERVTQGFGPVDHVTFREVENLPPQLAHGRPQAGVPLSFAALLDLARERIMLLHLDIKVPNIEDEVARLLDLADAWDHIVFVNEMNATRLRQHPKLHLLRYKVPGLYQNRMDMDPPTIARALVQPGEMILVGDPRVAAMVSGRKPYLPMPYSRIYRLIARHQEETQAVPSNQFNPIKLVRELQARFPMSGQTDLLGLLQTPPAKQERLPRGLSGETGPDQTAPQIVQRAWAAQRLGLRGHLSRQVRIALERLVKSPSWHPDHCYTAIDGAAAARALGKLRSDRSIPVLIMACRTRFEPGTAAERQSAALAMTTAEYRMALAAIHALSDIKSAPSKRFLKQYVDADAAKAASPAPALLQDATLALLRQRVAWDEIAELVRHKNPAVRGTAILQCIHSPGEERLQALRTGAPWAIPLATRRR